MNNIVIFLWLLLTACGVSAEERRAVPVPTRDQLKLQEMEMYAFIHYSMNTYTD